MEQTEAWRTWKTRDVCRRESVKEKMSNVTVGLPRILAEVSHWGPSLSSGREGRGASSKNRCQGLWNQYALIVEMVILTSFFLITILKLT